VELDEARDRLRSFENRLDKAKEEMRELRKAKDDAIALLDEAKEDAAAARSVCDDAFESQRQLQEELDAAKRQLSIHTARDGELEAESRDSADLGVTVSELRQELGKAVSRLDDAGEELSLRERRIGALEKMVSARDSQVESMLKEHEQDRQERARGVVDLATSRAAQQEAENALRAASLKDKERNKRMGLETVAEYGLFPSIIAVSRARAGDESRAGMRTVEQNGCPGGDLGDDEDDDVESGPSSRAAHSRAEAEAEAARLLVAS